MILVYSSTLSLYRHLCECELPLHCSTITAVHTEKTYANSFMFLGFSIWNVILYFLCLWSRSNIRRRVHLRTFFKTYSCSLFIHRSFFYGFDNVTTPRNLTKAKEILAHLSDSQRRIRSQRTRKIVAMIFCTLLLNLLWFLPYSALDRALTVPIHFKSADIGKKWLSRFKRGDSILYSSSFFHCSIRALVHVYM